MKNKTLLGLIPLLALTACQKNTVVGKYVFQMGSTSSTHIGITVELTDKKFESASVTRADAKEFTFDLDYKGEGGTDITEFKDLLDGNMRGYYYEGKQEAQGKRIHVGTTLLEGLFEDIPEVNINIDPEITEKILTCYKTDRTLDLYIPVSFKDLQHQLVWYGSYIDINTLTIKDLTEGDTIDLPGDKQGEDRIGTVPTPEEVDAMNEQFKEFFESQSFTFRAFHTLKMGLTKE